MTTYDQILAAIEAHEAEHGDEAPPDDPHRPPGYDPVSDWDDDDWNASAPVDPPWPDVIDRADHHRKQLKEGDAVSLYPRKDTAC